LILRIAFEKSRLQLVEFPGDVVVLMKRRSRKDGSKNIFRENVLDQHFAHIGFGEARINRLLSVLEEFFGSFSELWLAFVGALDHRAQRFQDFWQIGSKLLDGFAELRNLSAFVVEEKLQKLL